MRSGLLCWLAVAGACAALACSHDYQDFRFMRTHPEVGGAAGRAGGSAGGGAGGALSPDASAGGGAGGGGAANLPDAGGSDAGAVSDASSG